MENDFKCVYPVLLIIMKEQAITLENIASELHMSIDYLERKFSGDIHWYFYECMIIKKRLNQKISIEDLFYCSIYMGY